MQYPTVFGQNCTNPNRFNRFGLGAIMPAEAMAYSAFAPQNCRVGNTDNNHTSNINCTQEVEHDS